MKRLRWNSRRKHRLMVFLLILISCGLCACNSRREEDTVSESKISIAPLEEVSIKETFKEIDSDSENVEVEDQNNKDQEHDAGYFLNNNESVGFQQATWNFAKAYFSADKDQLANCLAENVKAEVWEQDVFAQLNRLILKWNPQELSTDRTMNVQYEFILEGEDSCTYLNMALKYQNEQWVITDYNLEK